MWTTILTGLTLLGQILKLVHIGVSARREKDGAIKKEKEATLKLGIRAVVDGDSSGFHYAIQRLNRLRKK